MPFSELSDEKLMRDASMGRFSAFEEFMQRHQGRVLNFYWRLSGSEEIARSLFEPTWAEFYRLRGTQAAAQGAALLLFSVAARKGIRLLSENPSLAVARGVLEGGDRAALSWRNARLGDALLSLPLRERAALLLCFFDSLSYAAAAVALNEREDNVRSLAGQGLGRLKETLGDNFLSAGLS